MTANNLPPRLYYHLDEAAQLLGCTERDLLARAANREIVLAAFIKTATGAIKRTVTPVPGFIEREAEAIAGFPLPKITPSGQGGEGKDRYSGWAIPGECEMSELAMSGSVKEGGFYFLARSSGIRGRFHWYMAALRVTGLPLMASDLVAPASEIARLAPLIDRHDQPAPPQDIEPFLKHAETAPNLVLLFEAYRQFWSTYDPEEWTTAPKNEDVQAWLKKQGVSPGPAAVMAQILRPEGLPAGRRPAKRRN